MNMRLSKFLPLAAASVAAYAMALPAAAQQPGTDAPPPPQMEKLEEGEEPAVTIRKPEQRQGTTEKRARGGKVTEVKVTSGGSTYYLKPNDQAGTALAGDAQSNGARAAQWEVKTFDLSPEAYAADADAAQEAAAAPASAPAAAPAGK